MAMDETISALAEKWLREDQDPETRKQIEDLVQAQDTAELDRRLRKRIAFGTAGLRASMKAGYAHMNSLIVLQATQGLVEYIWSQTSTRTEAPAVVIGYDARYNSEKFARLAAGECVAKGLKVLWFGQLVHTPLVPFAVKHFQAAAGVMVTASHNPKNDNGYKVYWSNGSQIIPPHDAGIAKCIGEVSEVMNWDSTVVDSSPSVQNIYTEARQEYFKALQELAPPFPSSISVDPFVYTAMHGVGLPFMERAVAQLNLQGQPMKIVQAQAQPDPEFPTVPFPNPEEKGALNLAVQEADRTGSDIALANDPDADRFSAAERMEDGSWHQLTGNQLGALLASYTLETHRSRRSNVRPAMLATTVSSRMLASMARVEGFHFRETLTGFKWLGNVGQSISQGSEFETIFAFEEAIGFMFPSVVWDKDGVAAATVFLRAREHWKRTEGLTPWGKFQSMCETYGYFEDANTYLISPTPDVTEEVFGAVRTMNGGKRPELVGSRKIRRWRDLTVGFDTAGEGGQPDLPVDKTAQMITCELGDEETGEVVFTARGSGTEPKIKLYIEGKADSSEKAKSLAREVLKDLLEEWFKPEVYGLKLAGS